MYIYKYKMLLDNDNADILAVCVECNDIDAALTFINDNALDEEIDKMVLWFCNQYHTCSEKKYWIDFLEQILVTEWKNKQEQLHTFKKNLYTYAINLELRDLLIAFANNHIIEQDLSGIFAENLTYTDLAVSILDSLENKSNFYKSLINAAIYQCNAILLRKLYEHKSLNFDNEIQRMNLIAQDVHKFNILMNVNNEKALYIHEKMQPFVNPSKRICYKDALLVLAQVRNRKSYDYNPILIDLNAEKNQFEEYLQILSCKKSPTLSKFICAGEHYISGTIAVDNSKKAKLWLIDSLGFDLDTNELSAIQQQIIKKFASIFKHNQIYLSLEKRQHSHKGCSLYALDDTMHSYSLRLVNDQSIWEYLIAASSSPQAKTIFLLKNDSALDTIVVQVCPIPISLIRTMQSKKLFTEILNRNNDEQNLIVNKKGQTAFISAQSFFQNNNLSRKNKRLEYKLNKIIFYTLKFLSLYQPEEIENLMSFFTVNKFNENNYSTSYQSYLK